MKIPIKHIQSIEKQKTILVSTSLRITTQDGNKYIFLWGQNATPRDMVFKKLLDLLDVIGGNSVSVQEEESHSPPPAVASPTVVSPVKKEEEETTSQLNLNFGRFSRFEDD